MVSMMTRETLAATGTAGVGAHQGATAVRKVLPISAIKCEAVRNDDETGTLEFPGKNATECEQTPKKPNSRGRIRTGTGVTSQGILSPRSDSASFDSAKPSDDAFSDLTSRADNRNELDADMQQVVDAWPTLPEVLRAGILAMISSAKMEK
jgi:hypothetical protein